MAVHDRICSKERLCRRALGIEAEIEKLREWKSKLKTYVTNWRRALHAHVDNVDVVDCSCCHAGLDNMGISVEQVVTEMSRLAKLLRQAGRPTDQVDGVFRELDEIQGKYDRVVDAISDCLLNRPSRARTGVNSPTEVERARRTREMRALLHAKSLPSPDDSLLGKAQSGAASPPVTQIDGNPSISQQQVIHSMLLLLMSSVFTLLV